MAPGSIEDIIARLLLWSKRAPKGFARVEFFSEFARKCVVDRLRTELSAIGIPFHEIELPLGQPAPQVVNALLEQLNPLTSGVVSLSGFATAFSPEASIEDALQVFNFHRDNLARPTICQIWWFPSSLAEQFVRAVPDLDSWFMVRLQLTEVGIPSAEERLLTTQFDQATANIDDARRRSRVLVARFETALAAGTPTSELRQSLAIPAVNALRDAGAEKEARELERTLNEKISQSAS